MEDTFWVTNRFGEKLEALLRKPEGMGPFPVVLFVSGFGVDLHESRNSNDEISKKLIGKGFVTVQFSFAGRGNSQGDYLQMTLDRQGEQIADILTFIQQRRDIDLKRVGIHATSFGCPTTMVYLTSFVRHRLAKLKKKKPIAAVCFVSGVYNVSLRIQVEREENRIAFKRNNKTYFFDPFDNEIPVGADFWESLNTFDPIAISQQMTVPIFIIHGGKDVYIQTNNYQEVFNSWGAKEKNIKVFPGGDHGITDVPRTIREEFLTDVVEWFSDTLVK